MRRAYTLIEIILTVAITAILSIGMFKALEALAIRSEKVKALSSLSIDSQSALDQISALLSHRIPMSLVGFDQNDTPPYPSLEDTQGKTILQWYGSADESYHAGDYSRFVDLNRSDFSTKTLYSPQTDLSALRERSRIKWNDEEFNLSDIALFFPSATLHPYPITESAPDTITLSGTPPSMIYERYSLSDSAYALTRKADAACFDDADFGPDTLLLFYNYRPWRGESFCDGNVTVLATDVRAFRSEVINGTIRLSIDLNRSIRGSANPVRLSKQKVVF